MFPIPFNEEMDHALTEAYLHYKKGSIKELAKRFKCDHGVIRRRANQLNLPKLKVNKYNTGYRRWTAEEIRLLLEHEHYSSNQLESLFNKKGFQRSAGAIDCFRRSQQQWLLCHHRDEFTIGYSSFQISALLGINSSTVVRWMNKGLLKSDQPDGLNHKVKRRNLLEFMLNNPSYWDCKNIDVYWFVDLIREYTTLRKG